MPIAPAVRGRVTDTRIELIENTAIPMVRRDEFAREISKLWSDAQHKFVLIGRYLNQAKSALPHGEYEAMIARDLPFGRAVAHQLRTVAETIDAGTLPVERLPDNYSTVYQITTLSPEEREQAIRCDVIRPDVTRGELIEFKKALRQPASRRNALLRERIKLLAEQQRIAERLRAIAEELGEMPGAAAEH